MLLPQKTVTEAVTAVVDMALNPYHNFWQWRDATNFGCGGDAITLVTQVASY